MPYPRVAASAGLQDGDLLTFQLSKAVSNRNGMGMLRAERRLVDRQRALKQRPRRGQVALRP